MRLSGVAPAEMPELLLRTGTTVRTVERDIRRLQHAGVPMHVKRGPGGGYRIDARRVLPAVTFTPGEASALIASLVAVGPYKAGLNQDGTVAHYDLMSDSWPNWISGYSYLRSHEHAPRRRPEVP